MTEREWQLSKENAALKKALAQAQANLCQLEFNAAIAADKELGEKWEAPTEPKVKSVK